MGRFAFSYLLPQRFICKQYSQLCMFLDTLWTWRDMKIVNLNSAALLCFSGKSFLNQYKWFPSTAELNPDQNRGSQSAHSVGGLRSGCGSSLFGLNPFLVCVVVLWVDIANMWHLLSFFFSWSFQRDESSRCSIRQKTTEEAAVWIITGILCRNLHACRTIICSLVKVKDVMDVNT